MWIPRWLGGAYSKLYVAYQDDVFTFNDACEVLSLNQEMMKVVLSGLHRKGVLAIFSKGRPRMYRLVTPDVFILIASGKINRLELKQERYLSPVYNCFLQLDDMLRLTSFAVYGSVARGTASANSDVDFIVVSQDFAGSLAERIDSLTKVRFNLQDDLSLLRRHGANTSLSFYPLREEEVERLPIILLDVMEEAKIVYDNEGFLKGNLTRLRLKLAELGAKRVPLRKGWYWDLKPDHKPLEVINL